MKQYILTSIKTSMIKKILLVFCLMVLMCTRTFTQTMLYHTDFSPAQCTLDPLSFPDGWLGVWQGITGINAATGNQEPILPWNGTNSFAHLIVGDPVTVSTIGNYVENQIQQVSGPNGRTGYALYQNIKQNLAVQGKSTQTPLTLYRGDNPSSDVSDAYYSFWFKFQPDMISHMGINEGDNNWRMFTEWKTTPNTGNMDYRMYTHVVKDPSGNLFWRIGGDGEGHMLRDGRAYWGAENHTVPVPVGQWFKNEVYWHRDPNGTGRYWQAINGQVIVDHISSVAEGGLMGEQKLPINRIFLNNNYSSGTAPLYQWTTSLEIWDGWPCGEGVSCYVSTDTIAPTAPGTPSASNVSSSSLNLSWTASTDSSGVLGYKIYRCSGTNCTPGTQIGISVTNSFSDTGLTPNTTYTYTVRAYDWAGNNSVQSGSMTVTTLDASATNGGLVGLWTFDTADISDTIALDKSGSENNGTIKGTTSVSGKLGQALSFNGTSDYIYVKSNNSLQVSVFTYSAWVKPTGATDRAIIGGEGTAPPEFRINGNNTLSLLKQNNFEFPSSSGTVTNDVWSHVAVTYDALGNYVYYINGVASGSGTSLQTFDYSGGKLNIGQQSSGSAESFNGVLDDVRIYNRVLQATDISQLYTLGTTGLVAYWTLDAADISGSTMLDKSGNSNDGTISTGTTQTPGVLGQALSFGGSDYVAVPNSASIDLGTTLSLALWVKDNGNNTDGSSMFQKTGWSTDSPGYSIQNSGQNLYLTVSTSVGTTSAGTIPNIMDGSWHHIVYILNNGVIQGYKDGVLAVTDSYPQGTGFANTDQSLYFGGGFHILLDDIRIYNRELSASEVSQFDALVTSIGANLKSSNDFIKIFPNPLNTNFNIIISSETVIKDARMKIYDINGKDIKNVPLNNHQTVVERGELKSGMYFYRVTNNNEIIGNGKLVVK